jgi:hypothetical protein
MPGRWRRLVRIPKLNIKQMSHSLISFLSILAVFSYSSACEKNDKVNLSNTVMTNKQLIIKVGSGTFNATLQQNATAAAFIDLLPLTVNMTELNGNEKYFDLSDRLPTNASNPKTIQNGDLMLYGSNTLVLFYKSFSTPYSYTKLGEIDNPAGLATALGSGNVKVTFEVQ